MNEQFVNLIVRKVLAEMGQAPAAARPAPAGRRSDADADSLPKRVWLTTEMLAARVGGGKSVALAANEYLTPLAWDWAGGRNVEVLQATAAPVAKPSAPVLQPAALIGTLGVVVRRPDAKVQAVLASAARGGVALQGFADTDCPMCNAKAMCQAILAGKLAGGVVIDRYAAGAMVHVAKLAGIRPVQGVSAAAVVAALRQFDANVLVIGHDDQSVYAMRAMLDRFAAGRRVGRERTRLLDEIEKLEARR